MISQTRGQLSRLRPGSSRWKPGQNEPGEQCSEPAVCRVESSPAPKEKKKRKAQKRAEERKTASRLVGLRMTKPGVPGFRQTALSAATPDTCLHRPWPLHPLGIPTRVDWLNGCVQQISLPSWPNGRDTWLRQPTATRLPGTNHAQSATPRLRLQTSWLLTRGCSNLCNELGLSEQRVAPSSNLLSKPDWRCEPLRGPLITELDTVSDID
jgi:hypothetical protein